MQRLIMDMPRMISAAIRHAADHHGKTEVVALAIEGDQRLHHWQALSGERWRDSMLAELVELRCE